LKLTGNSVWFHLTEEGRAEFGKWISKKGSFEAVVLDSDETGAWVLFPGLREIPTAGRVPLMLVKWEYVLTAVYEFRPEAPASREGVGFVPGSGRSGE